MTRVGLISDIHGDAARLQQALDLLQQHSVSSILCAGDLVDGADQPEAVINTLHTHRITCVQGNHDSDKANAVRRGRHDPAFTPQSIDYLEALPFSHTAQFADKTLLLIHATPWHNGIHVFSYSGRTLLDQFVDQAGDAEIIVIGHTHEPMVIHYRDRLILNPGAVYQNRFEDQSTCAVLDVPTLEFQVLDIRSGRPVSKPALRLS